MTDSNTISRTQTGSTVDTSKASQQAFGSADFLSIMLSEITNQDPLNPSDTSKMVESMRQLQSVANTASEKNRADITWAQQMVGQMVNVTQVVATDAQKTAYVNYGLNPDVGFANKDIRVEGFRVVNKEVWVQSSDGKNYPIDNIKQVLNDRYDTTALMETSNRLLGMNVSYLTGDSKGTRASGVVTSVGYDSEGKVSLSVGGKIVAYDSIVGISVPSTKANTTP
jgi:flagellar hook assembly protein FlgD